MGEIGLGTWQLGADWGKKFSKEEAFGIMQTAVECGVNFFDTADVYGNGQSERFIGDFIRETGHDIFVATKFGRSADVFPSSYTREAMQNSIEGSISRIGKGSLDLLQLHCIPTVVLQSGEVFDWLRDFKTEGLIKDFGVSVESVEEGLSCLEQEGVQSLQVIFNVFRQKLVRELLPQATDKGVGIIVRLPLASGLLAGKFDKNTSFSEDDHRHYNRDGQAFNVGETFAGLPFERGVELTEKLRSFVPKDMSMVDFTMRWILDHEAVSAIIPGATRPSQVRGNTRVSGMAPLTDDVHEKLWEFYHNNVEEHIRGVY